MYFTKSQVFKDSFIRHAITSYTNLKDLYPDLTRKIRKFINNENEGGSSRYDKSKSFEETLPTIKDNQKILIVKSNMYDILINTKINNIYSFAKWLDIVIELNLNIEKLLEHPKFNHWIQVMEYEVIQSWDEQSHLLEYYERLDKGNRFDKKLKQEELEAYKLKTIEKRNKFRKDTTEYYMKNIKKAEEKHTTECLSNAGCVKYCRLIDLKSRWKDMESRWKRQDEYYEDNDAYDLKNGFITFNMNDYFQYYKPQYESLTAEEIEMILSTTVKISNILERIATISPITETNYISGIDHVSETNHLYNFNKRLIFCVLANPSYIPLMHKCPSMKNFISCYNRAYDNNYDGYAIIDSYVNRKKLFDIRIYNPMWLHLRFLYCLELQATRYRFKVPEHIMIDSEVIRKMINVSVCKFYNTVDMNNMYNFQGLIKPGSKKEFRIKMNTDVAIGVDYSYKTKRKTGTHRNIRSNADIIKNIYEVHRRYNNRSRY